MKSFWKTKIIVWVTPLLETNTFARESFWEILARIYVSFVGKTQKIPNGSIDKHREFNKALTVYQF